jgi:hypothetical protein
MRDGAPPYFLPGVQEFFEVFLEQWMGRAGPTAQFAHSPDLNPFGFYLWEHLKCTVCATEVSDIHNWQQQSRADLR